MRRNVPSLGREAIEDELVEKRRTYNREYMRVWRAAAANRVQEIANRRRWYYERKVREALKEEAQERENHREPICGFCRKEGPISEIVRLQVCDETRGGYVEVRVPYCGRC